MIKSFSATPALISIGDSAVLQWSLSTDIVKAGVSGYTNDEYGDGQLFMKSRAGAFLNAGGLPLVSGMP